MRLKSLILGICCLGLCLSWKQISGINRSKIEEDQNSQALVKTQGIEKFYPQDFFSWPIKGEIDLTGNFGEIRTNHFHSGIDIRTNKGQVGVPVYASGDGYIWRINVSTTGYGKAIYISHANGFTTVYGHLMSFAGEIATYTTKQHYEQKKSQFELYPEQNLIKVKRGDLIAYSGNTGGSAGPHLHFEIRDCETSEAINPLLFGLKLNDKAKPYIKAITLFGLNASNRINTGTYRQAHFLRNGKTIAKPHLFVSPGTYAIGADWTDYLHEGGFRMGIPYAELLVNNQKVFTQKIERLAFNDWRMVNCHLDHPMQELEDKRIIKLFRDDGNTLDFYPETISDGRLKIEVDKKYSVKLIIKDFAGHKDSIEFDITGNTEESKDDPKEVIFSKQPENAEQKVFYPNQDNEIELKGEFESLKVIVPKGVLYDTIQFYLAKSNQSINGKTVWEVMNSSIPIHDSFTLVYTPKNAISPPGIYVMVRLSSSGAKKPEPGYWDGKSYIAKAKMLGKFYMDEDIEAPQMTNFKSEGVKFKANVTDNLSGIKEIRAFVDDQWILTEYDPKTNLMSGEIPEEYLKQNDKLRLIITDNCGNKSGFSQTIVR